MRIQSKMQLEIYQGLTILSPLTRKWRTLTSSGYYDVISQNFQKMHYGNPLESTIDEKFALLYFETKFDIILVIV